MTATAESTLNTPLQLRRARPVGRAAFASDFHLHGGDPAGVARATAFVKFMGQRKIDALFLLGDVFRAWLGRPSLQDPGLQPFLAALGELSGRGVWVVMIHGNHDFMMGAELTEAHGIDVVPQQLTVSLGGQRVLLTHGDKYCTLDLDYQRLHRVLRSRPLRWLWSAAPPTALSWCAKKLLSSSNQATVAKPMGMMSIVDRAVKRDMTEGADVVLCGHVHRARDDTLAHAGRTGRLVVMADFETMGSHAFFEEGHLMLTDAEARWAAPTPPVLAIDGPAGSGKSAVSKALAKRLGWIRLDSGSLYRAFALAALEQGLAADDDEALTALAKRLDLRLDARGAVTLNGQPVADEHLRSKAVSAAVSPMSAVAGVRAALLSVQRRVAQGQAGLVAEGRDMASVVFPQATLAVYLDALPEVRAARRMAQNPGEGRTLGAVTAALTLRDRRDSGRANAPLTRVDGAVVLETSELNLSQVVDRVAELLAERLLELGAALAGDA
ncbi:MAG: cytidylate kinase [Pseudohongiellaceae bacterium]|jgi:cytidylate kinase